MAPRVSPTRLHAIAPAGNQSNDPALRGRPADRQEIGFRLLPALLLFPGLEVGLRLPGIPEEKDPVQQFAFPPPSPVNEA